MPPASRLHFIQLTLGELQWEEVWRGLHGKWGDWPALGELAGTAQGPDTGQGEGNALGAC